MRAFRARSARPLARVFGAGLRRAFGPFAAVVAALGAGGCSERVTTTTFVEPMSEREYEVVARVDHAAKEPAGVLFALHAYSTAPGVLPASWSLAKHAVEERGLLLVVPKGKIDDLGRPFWNASVGCCGETRVPPDDLAYLRGVLADVGRRFAVDRGRVYAVGISNGAFMAHRWACAPGGDLRGIVAVSGTGPGPLDPPCAPSVPVRVMHVHGDADDVIRYEGGQGSRGPYASVATTVGRWRALDGCTTPAKTGAWSLLHGSTHRETADCTNGAVVLWTFDGGGHRLRSVRFSVGELLDFLERT